MEWHDSETDRLLIQAKAGKQIEPKVNSKIEILENKIKVLESARDADRKELQLLRQTVDLLIKNEIKTLQNKAGDNEFSLNSLQGQISKLQETLQKIRDHQLKNTKDPKDGR